MKLVLYSSVVGKSFEEERWEIKNRGKKRLARLVFECFYDHFLRSAFETWINYEPPDEEEKVEGEEEKNKERSKKVDYYCEVLASDNHSEYESDDASSASSVAHRTNTHNFLLDTFTEKANEDNDDNHSEENSRWSDDGTATSTPLNNTDIKKDVSRLASFLASVPPPTSHESKHTTISANTPASNKLAAFMATVPKSAPSNDSLNEKNAPEIQRTTTSKLAAFTAAVPPRSSNNQVDPPSPPQVEKKYVDVPRNLPRHEQEVKSSISPKSHDPPQKKSTELPLQQSSVTTVSLPSLNNVKLHEIVLARAVLLTFAAALRRFTVSAAMQHWILLSSINNFDEKKANAELILSSVLRRSRLRMRTVAMRRIWNRWRKQEKWYDEDLRLCASALFQSHNIRERQARLRNILVCRWQRYRIICLAQAWIRFSIVRDDDPTKTPKTNRKRSERSMSPLVRQPSLNGKQRRRRRNTPTPWEIKDNDEQEGGNEKWNESHLNILSRLLFRRRSAILGRALHKFREKCLLLAVFSHRAAAKQALEKFEAAQFEMAELRQLHVIAQDELAVCQDRASAEVNTAWRQAQASDQGHAAQSAAFDALQASYTMLKQQSNSSQQHVSTYKNGATDNGVKKYKEQIEDLEQQLIEAKVELAQLKAQLL